jgi:hypothetical protein
MKLMAALALACGFITAPMMVAGNASASPCDSAGCVPNVARGVAQGEPCTYSTRYVFGLDSSGTTLVCTARSQWAQSVPLIGVRTMRAPCKESGGAAQSPDGVPMTCWRNGWTGDYTGVFFTRSVWGDASTV